MKKETPDLPRGVTLHRGKLRIAFTPPGFKNQVKRSLKIPLTKANIKFAQQKLGAIQHDILTNPNNFDIGVHFPNDPLSKKTPFYLPDIFKEFFMQRTRAKKSGTLINHQSRYNHLVEHCAKIDGRDMDERDALFVQNLLSSKLSVGVTNVIISHLSTAFKRAYAVKRVEHNPFAGIESLVLEKEERKPLDPLEVYTIAEAEKLIAATQSEEKERVLTFLFWTGMRPGEVAALERKDLDLPYITVRRNISRAGVIDTPKTAAGHRRIFLPERAVEVLEKQLAFHNAERIWTHTRGETYDSPVILRPDYFKRLCARAELRYLVPYKTRHSFISWMLAAGELPLTVANHVGHKDTSTIEKVYGVFIPKKDPKWTLDDPKIFESVKNSMKSGN